ncbi:MAG: type II toxin-antitoxin system Phd/YefM family antitoxin [Caulobacteraceae bacterium]
MSDTIKKGAEEARNRLPDLLAAAEKGRSTIITRHGRPIAVLAPVEEHVRDRRQPSLLALEGSGPGLWGKSSARAVDQLRDEWSR